MSIFNRGTVGAFVLGVALAAGAGALAVEHRMGAHQEVDVSAHAERMLKHLYVEVDATDAQKARIDPLVRQAVQELMPMHAQLHGAHVQLMQAFEQPTIDRAALEAQRVQGLQMADQASKRLVQLAADVGQILTPEQRKKLAEHHERMHGKRHG